MKERRGKEGMKRDRRGNRTGGKGRERKYAARRERRRDNIFYGIFHSFPGTFQVCMLMPESLHASASLQDIAFHCPVHFILSVSL